MLNRELFRKTVLVKIVAYHHWSPDELAIEWKGSTCIARVLVDSEVTLSYQLDNVVLEDLFGEKADPAYYEMLSSEVAARLNYQYQRYKRTLEQQDAKVADDNNPPAPATERIQFNTDNCLDSNLEISKDPPIRLNKIKQEAKMHTRLSFEPGCGILFHDGGQILSESDIHFSYTGKLTIGDLKKTE